MPLPDIHQQLPALQEWIKQHLPQLGSLQNISSITGGYSNLTFRITIENRNYILRMPPPGASVKTAHDMGREFRVLTALRPHYPLVPEPLSYCDDTAILGAPFYIMQELQGVILRPGMKRLAELSPETFTELSQRLIENLASLHAIDIHTTGLIQLGKPEGYVQRQVTGWTQRYFQSETDVLHDMNGLADWLARQQPQSQAASLLHNDYKYDNVLMDVETLSTITGVLDWEMATIGDPLMDLGAALAYWFEADDPVAFRAYNISWLPGNFSRQACADLYAERSGRDLRDLLFYYVFGLFKNAVIAQQIYFRWKQGLHRDNRFEALLQLVQSLGRHGVQTLEKNRIS
jgi:aminoglycoside phosphotransferase (APT) family kinase protein